MFFKRIKLTTFIFITCLCISIMPIIIYMILSMFIFGRGLDTINKTMLINSIIDYTKKIPIPDYIKIINDSALLPKDIRASLPKSLHNGDLYRGRIISSDNDEFDIFFLVPFLINGEEYISYQIISEKEADIFIKPEVMQTIYILCISSFIILMSNIILIKFLINKVLSPINILEKWVDTLSINTINIKLPHLKYPELYKIANFIKSKFISEYEYIKSEEVFWKFCSHELRTPISIIRVGIEVLQKYIAMEKYDFNKYNEILEKLKKSSFSMSNIIETILWINRKNGELSLQKVNLAQIVTDIISDFKKIYILDNCNINIFTQNYIIRQPELAVRIVIENLIRNAFQHSIGEEIFIIQLKNKVKIINKVMPKELENGNTGFGLGHELVKRLANRLNWDVRFISNSKYNFVSVQF